MGEKVIVKNNESSEYEAAIREDFKEAIDHGILVSNLAYLLAKELRMSEEYCKHIAVAGMLHDIGKLKVSKYLYQRRNDTLLVEQMKYVRMHPTFSYEILRERGYDDFVLESIYHHHENYDGSGYPDNLKDINIPYGARILRTCDVFSALVSTRAYRSAFDIDTAMELMIDEVKNFDMEIFLAFQRVINSEQFEPIKGFIKKLAN
ncbi:HD-GYP domain [Lachnospiraceae bacterium KM106-2]|nr:HD-GYP domain [Lachnospiraceae bacterium KM106-2]